MQGRGEDNLDPPLRYNTVNAKWSTRFTPLEPSLRIGPSGHGLPRLASPALFYLVKNLSQNTTFKRALEKRVWPISHPIHDYLTRRSRNETLIKL